MEMKRAVILCLSLLFGLVLLVKCVDDGALNGDDEGDSEVFGTDEEEYTFEDNEFGTDGGEFDGDGGEIKGDGDDDDEEEELSLKCLVCKTVMEVMLFEIEKVDHRKRIQVTSTKSIQYSKSETYLAELMEDICEYEDTFATIRQVLVQKTIIKKMLKNDGAVEEDTPDNMSKKLTTENVNYLCFQILEENDEIILKEFMKEELDEIDEIVCTQTAQYCDKKETDNSNDRDEL